MKGFPYMVVYSVKTETLTDVIAILHQKQKPGKWKKRLQSSM